MALNLRESGTVISKNETKRFLLIDHCEILKILYFSRKLHDIRKEIEMNNSP